MPAFPGFLDEEELRRMLFGADQRGPYGKALDEGALDTSGDVPPARPSAWDFGPHRIELPRGRVLPQMGDDFASRLQQERGLIPATGAPLPGEAGPWDFEPLAIGKSGKQLPAEPPQMGEALFPKAEGKGAGGKGMADVLLAGAKPAEGLLAPGVEELLKPPGPLAAYPMLGKYGKDLPPGPMEIDALTGQNRWLLGGTGPSTADLPEWHKQRAAYSKENPTLEDLVLQFAGPPPVINPGLNDAEVADDRQTRSSMAAALFRDMQGRQAESRRESAEANRALAAAMQGSFTRGKEQEFELEKQQQFLEGRAEEEEKKLREPRNQVRARISATNQGLSSEATELVVDREMLAQEREWVQHQMSRGKLSREEGEKKLAEMSVRSRELDQKIAAAPGPEDVGRVKAALDPKVYSPQGLVEQLMINPALLDNPEVAEAVRQKLIAQPSERHDLGFMLAKLANEVGSARSTLPGRRPIPVTMGGVQVSPEQGLFGERFRINTPEGYQMQLPWRPAGWTYHDWFRTWKPETVEEYTNMGNIIGRMLRDPRMWERIP